LTKPATGPLLAEQRLVENTPMLPPTTWVDRSLADRLLGAYAEIEPWMNGHIEAEDCPRCEDAIRWSVRLLQTIPEEEGRKQQAALAGDRCAPDELDRYPELYKLLLSTMEARLAYANKLEAQGCNIDGLADFLVAIEEIRALVGNQEIAEDLIPIEERLAMGRLANPNPARYGD